MQKDSHSMQISGCKDIIQKEILVELKNNLLQLVLINVISSKTWLPGIKDKSSLASKEL